MRRLLIACPLALLISAAGCTSSSGNADSTASGGPIQVVVTINAWGSIASQLGGNHVHERSLITNPNTDPHAYEPTPADSRAVATAQMVVENGIGYDSWMSKLLAANPDPMRTVLDVGRLVGIPLGGNPHRWYSPANVDQVVARIAADYEKIDPAGTTYFKAQETKFETEALSRYHHLVDTIRSTYSGTPVGASESIFTPLSNALGLDLITPPDFLKAISEGTDPSPADNATIDNQIATRAIKVYIFNSQNATPDVAAQVNDAKARRIAVATVTETLWPANATFQDWQANQLKGIEDALHRATGR